MKFQIKHEYGNRMRIHVCTYRMTCGQADILQYYLQKQADIESAKVYDRTGDAVIEYKGDRDEAIRLLRKFSYENEQLPEAVAGNTGRSLSHEYQDKLFDKIVFHYARKWFLPYPLRACFTTYNAIKYIAAGIRCLRNRKIEVPVLDATARGDIGTAGSIMFMLGIGELLEEWTHKKSVDDLARTMSLNVSSVWCRAGDEQVLVPVHQIKKGDYIIVRVGNMIPLDGVVREGEAMVNQASLTGESVPVEKKPGTTVYAGTVVEDGELVIEVQSVGGNSRYEKIVTMIEESEKLKSGVESKAEHLADKLVPYSLGATGLVWLLTRNTTKALAVLMVDFSCALKLAMPVSVLSAIREAGNHHLTVKGGKFLEAVADADTIVFDKTGTLTKAQPTVAKVVSFNGEDEDGLLKIAACLEEHFPHSMARAVVEAAKNKGIEHSEMHSKVEYIVAHGIASAIGDKRVVIGSAHFVFEDEGVTIPQDKQSLYDELPLEYSHLYLAIDGMLAAVICIEDPVREEAVEVIRKLKAEGISKVVMMTGDSERTAAAIAKKVGVDEYYSEVLPQDKACFVEREKAAGRKVIMIGDGINDSPALSAADVGIAISDGAQLAREIADITIGADDLNELVTLKQISNLLMKRIHHNYRTIVSFNTLLIVLGVAGVIPPTTSALCHNTSTLLIGLRSMNNLLP